jgi:pimeloyl-ACP methyl ester carboxylesterase
MLDWVVVLSTQIRGTGRPLVLLPWFGMDHAVMAAAFEPVFTGTTGVRRIYIDLPGTGNSPPVEPYSDAVLDAITETVESITGAAPFLLAGCSYGGYLAAGMARRAPTQILGLLLVCPGVKIRPDQRNLSGVLPSTPQPRWLAEVPDELHEHFVHAIGYQTRSVANRVAQAFHLRGPTDDNYLAALRSTGYQLSDEDSARPFNGGVTILAGRRDRIAGHLDQFDSLAHYPHGDYVALADAGHYLPLEQQERFQTLTLDWLAQRESAFPDDTTVRLRTQH